MTLAKAIVAWWCTENTEPPERRSMVDYCAKILAQLRTIHRHDLAIEIREVLRKGKEQYLQDLAKRLAP
jgi:hypothetical protein